MTYNFHVYVKVFAALKSKERMMTFVLNLLAFILNFSIKKTNTEREKPHCDCLYARSSKFMQSITILLVWQLISDFIKVAAISITNLISFQTFNLSNKLYRLTTGVVGGFC